MTVNINHQQTNKGFESCIRICRQDSEKLHTVHVVFQGLSYSVDIENNDATGKHNPLRQQKSSHCHSQNNNARSCSQPPRKAFAGFANNYWVEGVVDPTELM